MKAKLTMVMVFLGVIALLAGACTNPAPGPVDLEVRDAAQALDAATAYLRGQDAQNAPNADIVWQEKDVTPPGWVGGVFKEFTSEEWTAEVSHPVVLPENMVYKITLTSIKLGWHWKGTVNADGVVTEESALKQMNEEECRKIAENFIRNSPTFTFDGIESTLKFVETIQLRCPYCWMFIFEFDSRHAGYGNRAGQMLAEVITPHKVRITVEKLEIISALMDEKWDMITQEMLDQPEKKPELVLIERPCEEFMNLQHISQEVEMAVGALLNITLCSNPSTGFQWSETAQISNETILEQIDHEFISPEAKGDKPPALGTPGQEVWTFQAIKSGTTQVSMEYSRPWEGGEKGEWMFFLTVIVK